MTKLIPFKQKLSSVEKVLQEQLQANPEDIATLGKLLILKIQEGKFDPDSDYAKGILHCIETAGVGEIELFLNTTGQIVEGMNWYSYKLPVEAQPMIEETITRVKESFKEIKNIETYKLTLKAQIYKTIFEEDKILENIRKIVPMIETNRESALGKTDRSSLPLFIFFEDVFKKIISKHGLSESLIYIMVFSSFPVARVFTTQEIQELLKKYKLKFSKNNKLITITENYLTTKFKANKLRFIDLFRLFALRYILKKPYSNVCKAILDAVSNTDLTEISKAFYTDFSFEKDSCSWILTWHDYAYGFFVGEESVYYKSTSSHANADFFEDFYIKLHNKNEFDYELAYQAYCFFSKTFHDLETCPLKYLILGSIYTMDHSITDLFYETIALYYAGIRLIEKRLYKESLTCFKTSLFNALFFFQETLPQDTHPIEHIDMDYFIQTTRKLNSYEDSINFLSKFRLLSEHGLPMHQGFLNEIEATKTELKYEHDARTYHKIDEFYELVAREDFPAVQSYVTKLKGQSKFVLTHDQLQILINKIQEKSDIIRGIKSISAKCDMLMYMHRNVYDKQAAIFEVMKDNQDSVEHLINQNTENTEKIIENIHKKNEVFISRINIETVQDYYHDAIGSQLWKKLDEGTRRYLMLARHLDTTNQFSPPDEFGFVAIEYAKAIENEFKKKIIDGYLSREQHIKYRASEGTKTIARDEVITLGIICSLIDKTSKVKDKENILWQFHSFIIHHTCGKQELFRFKNALFDIKNKYRNPAAHPSPYPRALLNSFKSLLFEKGFLKKYFEYVQIEK